MSLIGQNLSGRDDVSRRTTNSLEHGAIVDASVTSDHKYSGCTPLGWLRYFLHILRFTSEVDFNRNSLFPSADRAGICRRLCRSVLLAPLGDAMGLVGSVAGIAGFIYPHALTLRWSCRTLLRLGV